MTDLHRATTCPDPLPQTQENSEGPPRSRAPHVNLAEDFFGTALHLISLYSILFLSFPRGCCLQKHFIPSILQTNVLRVHSPVNQSATLGEFEKNGGKSEVPGIRYLPFAPPAPFPAL